MKNILFVFGTRPEAIKMAPVIKLFKDHNNIFNTKIAVTAQHRQMLDQVLNVFDILPDYDLNLMSDNQTLDKLTGKILYRISSILDNELIDLLFVQGDTTTTFAASLAAFYKKVPIAHIEAGLRTNNIHSPFPEESNRRMTTSIATYHFPPTDSAYKNLINEGIDKNKVIITGNTVIDSLLFVSKKIDSLSKSYESKFLNEYNIKFKSPTILVTGHRRESFGKGLENICNAIKSLAQNNDVQFIYPVHLNPNVQHTVNNILDNNKNIFLIEPQDYLPFIFLLKKSYLILTDSGGVQEEAPSLGKPVIIMRETTERMEAVLSGSAILVGTDKKKIINIVELLLNNKSKYNNMSKVINPYGTGDASNSIFKYIAKSL